MKKIFPVLYFFIFIFVFSEDKLYTDISKEHWAYRAIENLTNKGILIKQDDIFKGNEKVDRYEFAFYLSKILNKLNEDKASKEDLLIMENLVYEFSKDLNIFGFDVDEFTIKLNKFTDELDKNKELTNKNKTDIEKLNTRLALIEKGMAVGNLGILNKNDNYFNKLKYLDYVGLFLKTAISYEKESEKNESEEELTLKQKDYEHYYELGLEFNKENFELILKAQSKKDETESGVLSVNAQINESINQNIHLSFHTRGYEKYFRSYYGNVYFDNFSSVSDDKFNSYGVSARTKNIGVYIEKTENLGEVKDDYDFNLNETNSYTLNLIADIKFNYFESLMFSDLNGGKTNYELIAKYPDYKKFLITGGLAHKKKEDQHLYYVTSELTYYGVAGDYLLGYERKTNEARLYDNAYTIIRFKLKDSAKINYKLEYIDTEIDSYFNHYIIFRNKGQKIETYISYKMLEMYKENYISKDRFYVNGAFDKDKYNSDNKFSEIMAKLIYTINEKFDIRFAYKLREKSKTDEEGNKKREVMSYAELNYNLNESMRGYFKFIENESIFNDRERDFNNDMYDLDYEHSTGILQEYKDGKFELGIEFKF